MVDRDCEVVRAKVVDAFPMSNSQDRVTKFPRLAFGKQRSRLGVASNARGHPVDSILGNE